MFCARSRCSAWPDRTMRARWYAIFVLPGVETGQRPVTFYLRSRRNRLGHSLVIACFPSSEFPSRFQPQAAWSANRRVLIQSSTMPTIWLPSIPECPSPRVRPFCCLVTSEFAFPSFLVKFFNPDFCAAEKLRKNCSVFVWASPPRWLRIRGVE